MSLLLPGESHHWEEGRCLKVHFANGFGLSVIWGGLWFGDSDLMEIAVTNGPVHSLCYSTYITDNVIVDVTLAEARDIVSRVRALVAA